MDGLGSQGFDDLHTPLFGPVLQGGPGEGAEKATLKLPEQRLRIVVVDQLHGFAGQQCFEGGKYQWVAVAGGKSAQVGGGGSGGSVHEREVFEVDEKR